MAYTVDASDASDQESIVVSYAIVTKIRTRTAPILQTFPFVEFFHQLADMELNRHRQSLQIRKEGRT